MALQAASNFRHALVSTFYGALRLVAPVDASRHTWRNLHLMGNHSDAIGVLCYSGLASNGASSHRRIARELYRRFDRRIDFWQRNLWGHTGRFGHFRQSRMWNWFADAVSASRVIFQKNGKKQVFLYGHSTGSLLVCLVAYLYLKWPFIFGPRSRRAQLSGIILDAPAFRLQSRRNERLLLLILALYYVFCPLAFIAIILVNPTLWDFVVVTGLALFLLLPRVRVPARRAPGRDASREEVTQYREEKKAAERTAVILFLHFAVFPWIILIVSSILPLLSVRHFLWFYAGTIAASFVYLPRQSAFDADWECDEAEDCISPGYRWMPVVTAATLLPLQWLAARAIRHISCPVLIIVGTKDRVVQIGACRRAFHDMPSNDKQYELLPGVAHSLSLEEEQLAVTERIESWIRQRVHLPSMEEKQKFSATPEFHEFIKANVPQDAQVSGA